MHATSAGPGYARGPSSIVDTARTRLGSDQCLSPTSLYEASLGYPRLNIRGPDGSGLDRNLV